MKFHFLKTLHHAEQGFLLPAFLSFIIAMGFLTGAVLKVILTKLQYRQQ